MNTIDKFLWTSLSSCSFCFFLRFSELQNWEKWTNSKRWLGKKRKIEFVFLSSTILSHFDFFNRNTGDLFLGTSLGRCCVFFFFNHILKRILFSQKEFAFLFFFHFCSLYLRCLLWMRSQKTGKTRLEIKVVTIYLVRSFAFIAFSIFSFHEVQLVITDYSHWCMIAASAHRFSLALLAELSGIPGCHTNLNVGYAVVENTRSELFSATH